MLKEVLSRVPGELRIKDPHGKGISYTLITTHRWIAEYGTGNVRRVYPGVCVVREVSTSTGVVVRVYRSS